jgi:D-alanyl-D-alanine endopeptidase (penicillin-binding protein 7)
LKSHAVLVIDEAHGQILYAKNPENVMPIASITKLMTAMVVLDAGLPLDEAIVIDKTDVDRFRHTASRLRVGARLSRSDLLRLGLMSSENRAAAALGRTYPGGTQALVAAMNDKASELGMVKTRFSDATGLATENVSSAEDLARMVRAASQYPLIREFTTTPMHQVVLSDGSVLDYQNSNGLVKNKRWTIGLSKTGYLNEAGRCLVLKAEIAARPVIIVLLDSWGKYTRLGDANRIKKWMESSLPLPTAAL